MVIVDLPRDNSTVVRHLWRNGKYHQKVTSRGYNINENMIVQNILHIY